MIEKFLKVDLMIAFILDEEEEKKKKSNNI